MGRPKQLLPIGETPLICRILGEALSSQLDRIVVVLGHRAKEIARVIAYHYPKGGYEVVVNDRYPEGMASSIRAGINFIKDEHEYAMVLLADMVHIDFQLIDHLLRNYLPSGKALGAVTINGRRSHPVIFRRDLYPELLALKGDTGARALFTTHKEQVYLIPAGPGYEEMDVDTPEDYSRLIQPKRLQ